MNLDKISRIEVVEKNQAIEFARNKDEWQIVKPRPLRADPSVVSELVRKLTDAKMDLSVTDSKAAVAAFARGAEVGTAKVTDESGTQSLQVRKEKDTYYAKSTRLTVRIRSIRTWVKLSTRAWTIFGTRSYLISATPIRTRWNSTTDRKPIS